MGAACCATARILSSPVPIHDVIGDTERRAMSPLFWSDINPDGGSGST